MALFSEVKYIYYITYAGCVMENHDSRTAATEKETDRRSILEAGAVGPLLVVFVLSLGRSVRHSI